MPYIITTRESREAYERRRARDPGAYRQQGITHQAVATLDEAREAVMDVAGVPSDLGTWDEPESAHWWTLECARLPDHGGTVGPLQDGTVIEVERVETMQLYRRANLPLPDLAFRRTEAQHIRDAIDAYNAAQS